MRARTACESRLEEALDALAAFAERYAGKLGELDSAGLRRGDARSWPRSTSSSAAPATTPRCASPPTPPIPPTARCCRRSRSRRPRSQTTLLFFELEWAALSDERAEELLAGEGLDFCRHHLRNVRRYREHLLTEPEEKILAEKALTGAGAWTRLFEELTSAIEVELPRGRAGREPVALDVALSRLMARRPRVSRRTTAEAVTAALAPGLRTRAFLFNTLLADKATDDRLRRYPHWLAARNLANEASDESVQALIEAVRGRYEIARRWYRLKARLLGVERLADYDRMAAVTEDEVSFPFAQAREIVLDCYSSFSPRARRAGRALLRRAPDRRAGAPRQARRRLLRGGRARRCSRTCCSTTPPAAATCSRSRTSSVTASTSRSPLGRASSTSTRR